MQLYRDTQTEYRKNTLILQEKDRERLAGELHDNIISRLNLIRLSTPYKSTHELNTDLKNSMQLIRELSHNLTPPDLNEIKLTDLISDYLEQTKNSIDIDYYQSIFTKNNISNSIKLNTFRIVQELITNTLKHAGATKIKISLKISEKHLLLIVEDNGTGFTPGHHAKGIGLRSIELRSKQVKAIYKFKNNPQRGIKFIFILNILQ